MQKEKPPFQVIPNWSRIKPKTAPVVAADVIVAEVLPIVIARARGGVFPRPRGVAGIGLCAAKPSIFRHYSLPNVAGSFIDHSTEVWNFHADRMLIRCPCPMRKVKP
jgi:hypothetical protein